MLRKLILTLSAAFLACAPAHAQTGSAKTPAALNTEVNTLWPDNCVGCITPSNSRQTLLDIIASYTSSIGAPFLLVTAAPYNAKCDGLTDDTTAIQSAINAVPSGGTAVFPQTSCLVSSTITISKAVNLLGSGMQEGGILVSSGMSASTDLFHFVPNGNFLQERGWSVRNLNIQAQSGTPGRHLIHFDTTSSNSIFGAEVSIQYVSFYAPSGNAIYFDGGASGIGTFHSFIDHNYILAPVVLLNAGDTWTIDSNIISTNSCACGNPITISQVSGAGNIVITNNNITGGGGTVISNATGIVIQNNEFEQVTTNTEANNAVIDLTGTGATLSNPKVVGNQIQANAATGSPNLLRIGAATGAVVDNNRFGSSASVAAIINSASASGTVIGAGNLYVGTSANITDSGSGTLYARTSPVATGTPAVTASAPLAINAGTGNITITSPLPTANGGTGDAGAAWGAYALGPACGTATFTVQKAASKTIGKVTFVEAEFTITAIGTCTRPVNINLPNTSNSVNVMLGVEVSVNGLPVNCTMSSGATTAQCSINALANFLVNEQIVVSGTYENQ